MPEPKKTRKPLSARELANLKKGVPHPENLTTGSKRKPLTVAQMDFAATLARGIGLTQAALESGVTYWMARHWRDDPRVKQLVDEFRERLKDNSFEKINERLELRTEFLDRHTITRLNKAKKTDMAISKLIHTGYMRTGAIKPAQVSASATAAAAAAAVGGLAGGTMKQMYKSKWLRDKEVELATECENEYNNSLTSGEAEAE